MNEAASTTSSVLLATSSRCWHEACRRRGFDGLWRGVNGEVTTGSERHFVTPARVFLQSRIRAAAVMAGRSVKHRSYRRHLWRGKYGVVR